MPNNSKFADRSHFIPADQRGAECLPRAASLHVYEYRYLPKDNVLLIEFDDHDRVSRAAVVSRAGHRGAPGTMSVIG